MKLLTKRLPTILGLLLLVGMGVGFWWWIQNTRPVISDEIKPQKVRITNIADNKMSVSWITQTPTMGQVEYGEEGQRLSQIAMDDRGVKTDLHLVHHITLTKLQPNTPYLFRIISGENGAKFDNNGSPYSAITGKIIGGTPAATSLYGTVELAGRDGAIVYLALPNSEPASVLITNSGNYSIPIATIRSSDGRGYAKFDEKTTIASLSVEDGNKSALATVSMNNVTPIPIITMGQTYDFRNSEVVEPEIAQVKPIEIFNVEPLSNEHAISNEITILNPNVDGEELATTLPEFRGLAPTGKTLSITLHAGVVYTDTLIVETDGTWEWTPPEELINGQHDLTVSYVNSEGIEQKAEKSFFISTALAGGGDPAFESTPSAGTYASPTPISSTSARITTPSTESGVPVTGVMDYTLLTGAVGIVIMVLGAMMLAI